MSGKRLRWLDMAKGVAILLMVFGHCLDDHLWLHDFIYSFHMPLFFVLAGFTMRPKPRRQVIATSARRLLVPYAIVCSILFFFAFVPPSSISSALDTQQPWQVVLVEILYGSGQEGQIFGHEFQAIGALWFLPALFVARIVFNEILLAGEHLQKTPWCASEIQLLAAQGLLALVAVWVGFTVGKQVRLPFDVDTACVAVGYLYLGYLMKRIGMERVPDAAWLALAVVWMCFAAAGDNEMAVRAYLEHPWSLVTSAAGSLVVMRLCMAAEQVPGLVRVLAACGVSSLSILCVHRVESAILNWQKIMEFFCPDVWNWSVLAQGLYWGAMRVAFVLMLTFVGLAIVGRAREARAARQPRRRLQSTTR